MLGGATVKMWIKCRSDGTGLMAPRQHSWEEEHHAMHKTHNKLQALVSLAVKRKDVTLRAKIFLTEFDLEVLGTIRDHCSCSRP